MFFFLQSGSPVSYTLTVARLAYLQLNDERMAAVTTVLNTRNAHDAKNVFNKLKTFQYLSEDDCRNTVLQKRQK